MTADTDHGPACCGAGADALLAHAERVCVARGAQFTPLRRRVFAALAGSSEALGAYDLVERLGADKRVAPISVYRALDFLIEAGLIHRIATRNAYLPCHGGHGPHETAVFLVCTRCGHVDEVASPAVARGIDGMARSAGFRAEHRSVEIEGACRSCQEDGEDQPAGEDQAGATVS